jgi:hypothetical protein
MRVPTTMAVAAAACLLATAWTNLLGAMNCSSS